MSNKSNLMKCKNCKIITCNLENELCEVCTDIQTEKNCLKAIINDIVPDSNSRNLIFTKLKALIELSKEAQWQQDKAILFENSLSAKLNPVTTWRLLIAIQNVKGQPQHVTEWERDIMVLLHEQMKFSVSSIAFVTQRSKETVSRHLQNSKGHISA